MKSSGKKHSVMVLPGNIKNIFGTNQYATVFNPITLYITKLKLLRVAEKNERKGRNLNLQRSLR